MFVPFCITHVLHRESHIHAVCLFYCTYSSTVSVLGVCQSGPIIVPRFGWVCSVTECNSPGVSVSERYGVNLLVVGIGGVILTTGIFEKLHEEVLVAVQAALFVVVGQAVVTTSVCYLLKTTGTTGTRVLAECESRV